APCYFRVPNPLSCHKVQTLKSERVITLPIFRLVEYESGGARLTGTITQTTIGKENWVRDRCIGYLKAGGKLICGRWQQKALLWMFIPDNSHDIASLSPRQEWEVLDGYWGQRAEIVLNERLEWQKNTFESTDALLYKSDGTSDVMERGW